MANEQNLIPFTSDQSREEAKKNGAKGGVASGVARRKKNAARKWLAEIMAYKPVLNASMRAGILSIGGDPDTREYNNEALMMVALMQKAQHGDTKATRLCLEMFGEDPRTIMEEKRLKVEREAIKALKDSDGFTEALSGIAGEVFESGGDTPDNLTDGE